VGFTVTLVLAESTLMPPTYRYNLTVLRPDDGKHIVAGELLVVVIVVPAQDHRALSTVPVLVLVTVMQLSWHTVVALAVIDATGGPTETGVRRLTLSTANDGSVPTPSSLFTQRKPIFTVALLLAEAGNVTPIVSQRP
jgi:hypothetical protein